MTACEPARAPNGMFTCQIVSGMFSCGAVACLPVGSLVECFRVGVVACLSVRSLVACFMWGRWCVYL
jgi:hypothetical protein